MAKESRREGRIRRHQRTRKKVVGTPERPRLCVYRSLEHIYAQVIDDSTGNTLVSASTVDRELRASVASLSFDRGGYVYHGRVKAVADSSREAGLVF
jgi:large subunit ribosomal protein L18